MHKTTVILFGGSFDPIHRGHLRVGQAVVEQLSAKALIFVPARRSPHKSSTPEAGHHRLAMIDRAIADCDLFSVSDYELRRGEPSYSLDTIHFFRRQFGPDAELRWLIGADQLSAFDKWYKVDQLLDLCRVSVMHRAGYPEPNFDRFRGRFSAAQIESLEQNVVETPLIDISSTAIRRRLKQGDPCRDALPESVVHYIRDHDLYGFCG